MLGDLADWAARRRRYVVAVCGVVSLAAALMGRGLFTRLGYAVFYDPAAESTRGAALARTQFGDGDPDLVALYDLPDGVEPDDPRFAAALARTIERLQRDPLVARVVGATGPFAGRFVSNDRRSVFAVVSLRGDAHAKMTALPRLRVQLDIPWSPQPLQPRLGGLVPSGRALTQLAQQSLARGERIALPLVAVLLVLLFGSVVAALLPIAVGALSIVLTLAALEMLSHVLVVDAFAVNVVTILGLGVAIDYALFLVSRYREETVSGEASARPRALRRAVETAGRSVLFSSVTVAASLSGLLVFRQPFLRSIAVGGIVVTLMAATLALVVLPAALAILGGRLESGRMRRTHPRQQSRFWHRLASTVIRHRRPICLLVTLGLVLLAVPFRRMLPSRADVRALPETEEPRVVSDRLASGFATASLTPSLAVVAMNDKVTNRLGELYDYGERLRAVPGVQRVESLLSFAGVHDRDGAEALGDRLADLPATAKARSGLRNILNGRYTLVRVISTSPPDSPLSQQQVRALRTVAPPPGSHVLVYGQAAALNDFAGSVGARAPWMLGLVGAAMFIVLFLAFRSMVLPIKAMLTTALSLTASFGATVFVFQDGRFQHLLSYHSLGTTDATLPVLMFAIVFGLSMDYEVLILNRIREAFLDTGRNSDAIIEGLARTGRLVTGAALVMVVVFAAFTVAPVVFVKALGLGMALAVALDATIVRMLLVPSTMALLGRLNWWAPAMLSSRGPRARRRGMRDSPGATSIPAFGPDAEPVSE